MRRLEQVKETFFKTPLHTGVTMTSVALFAYTTNFAVNCATGNCNKTPEEINAHAHLWQHLVNTTVNGTTTFVTTTALSTMELMSENGLMGATVSALTGATSAMLHKAGSLFYACKKADGERAPLLTEGGSVNTEGTEPGSQNNLAETPVPRSAT